MYILFYSYDIINSCIFYISYSKNISITITITITFIKLITFKNKYCLKKFECKIGLVVYYYKVILILILFK
jgi:hypothetical protein